MTELRGDLCIVSNALKQIHAREDTIESIAHLLHDGIDLDPHRDQTEESGFLSGEHSPNSSEGPTRTNFGHMSDDSKIRNNDKKE